MSTNADDREFQMLREGVSGRVLVWANVRDAMAALLAARNATGNNGRLPGASARHPRAEEELAGWHEHVVHDSHMVQLLEKAVAAQAVHLLSAPGCVGWRAGRGAAAPAGLCACSVVPALHARAQQCSMLFT